MEEDIIAYNKALSHMLGRELQVPLDVSSDGFWGRNDGFGVLHKNILNCHKVSVSQAVQQRKDKPKGRS